MKETRAQIPLFPPTALFSVRIESHFPAAIPFLAREGEREGESRERCEGMRRRPNR